MATLKIRKVSVLPGTLEATTLYIVPQSGDMMIMYVTDSAGIIAYRTTANGDIGPVVNVILNSIMGQPNGIATLDGNGDLVQTGNVTAVIDGQNSDISSGGNSIWAVKSINTDGLDLQTLSTKYTKAGQPFRAFKDNRTKYYAFTTTLPLDYEPGTDLIVRINLFPISTSSSFEAGDALFRINYSTAIGMSGGTFNASVQNEVLVSFPATNGYDSSVPISVDFPAISGLNLRPNSVVSMKITRRGSNNQDYLDEDIASISTELYYKKDKLGSRNIAPDFYL